MLLKFLDCTEAVVALMLQSRLSSSQSAQHKDDIATVIVGEVHNRSAHSDYVLAPSLAAHSKVLENKVSVDECHRGPQLAQGHDPSLPEAHDERCHALCTQALSDTTS